MPTNGAPTTADLDRTVLLIRAKARRLGTRRVDFSAAGLKLASAEQKAYVEEQVQEAGLRVDWVYHG